jgi:hypothetical protein
MRSPDEGRYRRRPWSKADDRELRRLYAHRSTAEVAKIIGRTVASTCGRAFGLGLHKSQAYLDSPAAYRLRRDSSCGIPYRFPKGNVPANKGLRRPGYAPGRMKETQFKKGNFSKRWDVEAFTIGALRINADDIIDIKIKYGPRSWQSLAHYVWECAHGPLPKWTILRPINGDTHDTRLENLRIASRAELMRENTYHRYPKEIVGAIQLIGVLQRQINKREGKHGKRYRRPA